MLSEEINMGWFPRKANFQDNNAFHDRRGKCYQLLVEVMDFQLHALSFKLGRVKKTYKNNVDVTVTTRKLDDATIKGMYTCFIFPILLYYFSF